VWQGCPAFGAQKVEPLAHRYPTLQQERTDLIDDTGALADQPSAHAVQGLQVKLIGGLGGDEFHRRALHRLGNRPGVARRHRQIGNEHTGAAGKDVLYAAGRHLAPAASRFVISMMGCRFRRRSPSRAARASRHQQSTCSGAFSTAQSATF
jgi:hypothetical protein